MYGRLIGEIKCCLKWCENEAGSRKFNSMIGQCEMKCTPHDITSEFENLRNLRECDKHYGTYLPGEKSSSKSRSDAQ